MVEKYLGEGKAKGASHTNYKGNLCECIKFESFWDASFYVEHQFGALHFGEILNEFASFAAPA
jgi:hypothetical protein